MSFSSCSFKHIALLAASLTPVVFMTGCTMSSTAPATNSFSTAAVLSGQVHGGNQPITGAVVTLWEAGTTGYGSEATPVAQTTTQNDAYASFAFTQNAVDPTNPSGIIDASQSVYSCPTTGNPQMYIITRGGNTTPDGTNSDAVLIAAIGDCQHAAAQFVDLNEITTVATLAALQQYFNPNAERFGYPTTNPQALTGFVNGVATIANLASYITGAAVTSKTVSGTASTVAGTSVVITPETAKINTIADVLAACVNTVSNQITTSANCQTLFTNAVPPASATVTSQPSLTFVAATDTVQAAYYMLVNPTESGDNGTTAGKMFNLYTLAGGVGAPFQPALTTQPTDWTIGILYAATAGSPAVATTCTGAASGKFIFYAYLVRADANGNIWIASNGAAPENITEVSPTGVPMACVTPSSTTGAYQGLTIDTAGNIWASSHTSATVGAIYKIDPNTLAATPWTESGVVPWSIEADGHGDVFYTVISKPVHEFPGAATSSTAFASTAIGGNVGAAPNFMTIDQTGSIWSGEQTATGGLFQTYPDTSGTAVAGYSTADVAVGGSIQGQIAVDAAGKIWTDQTTPANSVTPFVPSATPGGPATGTATAAKAGGLNSPRGIAIDGAGNAWVPNGVANSGGNSVSEFDNNANPLSGAQGFGKPSPAFPTLRGVTVDPTGNVWIGTNATTVDEIEEIVGAGVPVVTPLSAQLAAGTVAKP